MSFDLYVFDVDDLPEDDEAIGELLEDNSGWDHALTPRLAAFVAELEASYPGLDVDPDGSPWSSWPLQSNSAMRGRCCGFNIAWSAADVMALEMRERTQRHGLTLYDPQSSEVVRPRPAGKPRRGLFRRRTGDT